MSKADTQRSRQRRARARGTCPGCNQPVDLVCHTCKSALCKRCHGLTGSLYARLCDDCREEEACGA